MRNLKQQIAYVIIGSGLPFTALALENPLGKGSTFYTLIGKIVDILVAIGIPVAVVFIIYSGFLFVTAGGSEDQVKKAKETLIWTIAGTALLVGAKTIAAALQSTVQSLGG